MYDIQITIVGTNNKGEDVSGIYTEIEDAIEYLIQLQNLEDTNKIEHIEPDSNNLHLDY